VPDLPNGRGCFDETPVIPEWLSLMHFPFPSLSEKGFKAVNPLKRSHQISSEPRA